MDLAVRAAGKNQPLDRRGIDTNDQRVAVTGTGATVTGGRGRVVGHVDRPRHRMKSQALDLVLALVLLFATQYLPACGPPPPPSSATDGEGHGVNASTPGDVSSIDAACGVAPDWARVKSTRFERRSIDCTWTEVKCKLYGYDEGGRLVAVFSYSSGGGECNFCDPEEAQEIQAEVFVYASDGSVAIRGYDVNGDFLPDKSCTAHSNTVLDDGTLRVMDGSDEDCDGQPDSYCTTTLTSTLGSDTHVLTIDDRDCDGKGGDVQTPSGEYVRDNCNLTVFDVRGNMTLSKRDSMCDGTWTDCTVYENTYDPDGRWRESRSSHSPTCDGLVTGSWCKRYEFERASDLLFVCEHACDGSGPHRIWQYGRDGKTMRIFRGSTCDRSQSELCTDLTYDENGNKRHYYYCKEAPASMHADDPSRCLVVEKNADDVVISDGVAANCQGEPYKFCTEYKYDVPAPRPWRTLPWTSS